MPAMRCEDIREESHVAMRDVRASSGRAREYDRRWEGTHLSAKMDDACQLLLVRSRPRNSQGAPIKEAHVRDARMLAIYVTGCLGRGEMGASAAVAAEAKMPSLADRVGPKAREGEAEGAFSEEEMIAALMWCALHGFPIRERQAVPNGIFDAPVQGGINLYEKAFGPLSTRDLRAIRPIFTEGNLPPYAELRRITRKGYEKTCIISEIACSHKDLLRVLSKDDYLLGYGLGMEEALWRFSGGATDWRSVLSSQKDEDHYRARLREMRALAVLWDRAAERSSDKVRLVRVDRKEQHYFDELFSGDVEMINATAYALGIDIAMQGVMSGLSVEDVAL